MSEIQIFKNPQFGEIRVSVKDTEPLFCLSDVCRLLDLGNPSQVKKRLKPQGIQLLDIQGVTNNEGVIINKLGNTATNYINESNLYKCIFQSRKHEAEAFQDWVCEEVLPSIRKTGGYIVSREDDTDAEIMARALLVAQSTIEKKNRRIAEQQKTIGSQEKIIREKDMALEVLNQKVGYLDKILASNSTVYTTQIAQDYGMSAKKFNALLKDLKLQHKVGRQWILNAPHHTRGYVHSETITLGNGKTVMDTKWTQKGRLFLYEKLKKKSILPLIEMN